MSAAKSIDLTVVTGPQDIQVGDRVLIEAEVSGVYLDYALLSVSGYTNANPMVDTPDPTNVAIVVPHENYGRVATPAPLKSVK